MRFPEDRVGCGCRFQCSSASRKFLNAAAHRPAPQEPKVSVLFSEPKIPQSLQTLMLGNEVNVSVLFSEPKIPQFQSGVLNDMLPTRFSALQRAENSSIRRNPKCRPIACGSFSALQRAENSSMEALGVLDAVRLFMFQCSSASRKFLNSAAPSSAALRLACFSALQRAENSSMLPWEITTRRGSCFSALQRAENSSMRTDLRLTSSAATFQCSSASRKFLNPEDHRQRRLHL